MKIGPLLLTAVKCPLMSVFSHQGLPCTVELSSNTRSRSINTFQPLRAGGPVELLHLYSKTCEREKSQKRKFATHTQTKCLSEYSYAFFSGTTSALGFLEEKNHSFLEELSACIKWLLAIVQDENSKEKPLAFSQFTYLLWLPPQQHLLPSWASPRVSVTLNSV